jgi:exosome complex component RRP42
MNNFAIDSILNGKRFDRRKMDDFRSLVIKTGIISKAEGSAICELGETKIIAGVKMGLGDPFPDTPDEGTIIVNAEFTPMASPDFESGPPGEDATELARVVDRGIRESECMDLKKLTIKGSEKVWSVFIDIHIINDAGNLIDASFIASMAALLTAKVPKVKDDAIDYKARSKDLEVKHVPIEVTVCKVADKFILDPDTDEESGVDAKLTVAVREDDMIVAMQKQGVTGITTKDAKEMIEIAMKKSKELRKVLEEAVKGK